MKKVLVLASSVLLFGLFSSAFAEESKGDVHNNKEMHHEMLPEMTMQELAKYNGKNGEKAYIAVDGIIYDVTNAEGWKDGVHTKSGGKVLAGTDGSKAIEKSPHQKNVLKELKKVGKLKK